MLVSDKDKFIELIDNAKANEDVDLSECSEYLSVTFDGDPVGNGKIEYCWKAIVKRAPRRNIFPMRDTQYVKIFKTLNGAKKHFKTTALKYFTMGVDKA